LLENAATLERYRDPHWGAEKLSNMALFKKFSKDELRELYQCGRFTSLRPQANAVIEGETSRGLYIILEGTVSVYKSDPDKDTLSRLAVLEAGAYFGELSLFDSSPRSATVTAETTCQCFVLDADQFHHFLQLSGDNLQLRFYKTCAEELVDRFRKLNNDYINSQNMLWRYAFRNTD
jgi:CRP-like cAMP-binding protein